ncbi:hypothetical protein K2X33_15790 [bacterium]|nr:hypothetical protein [bacterium]
MSKNRPNLVLIRGGAESLGPVSRMGLWARFPQTSTGTRVWLIAGKVLLLGSLVYYLYGN